ncbi:MAG: hypothetical protein U0930_04945 [Pirellulales bacterium]
MKFTGSKLTLAELKPALKRAQDQVDRFNAQSGPLVDWGGTRVKAISEECYDALEELCKYSAVDNADCSDKPQDREAIMALDDLTEKFIDFKRRVADGDSSCNPGGTHEMWMSLMVLREKVFTPRELKAIESIRRLVEIERVPSPQICQMYGWIGEDGTYQIEKIDEELAEPGKHSTKDPNWVNPIHKQYFESIAKAWENRVPNIDLLSEDELQFLNRSTKKKRSKANTEAPESLDELILQGVSTDQIVRMKPSVTAEQVETRRDELSLQTDVPPPHDARFAPPADTGAALMEQQTANDAEQAERERKSAVKAQAQKTRAAVARAKELKAQGKSIEEITATISSEFPGVEIGGLVTQ